MSDLPNGKIGVRAIIKTYIVSLLERRVYDSPLTVAMAINQSSHPAFFCCRTLTHSRTNENPIEIGASVQLRIRIVAGRVTGFTRSGGGHVDMISKGVLMPPIMTKRPQNPAMRSSVCGGSALVRWLLERKAATKEGVLSRHKCTHPGANACTFMM
jgi:hypothetical protein